MHAPPLPEDESQRLDNLRSYEILDTAAEKDFDDLAELISLVTNCKYSFISFMDSGRQWFKAKKGISIKEIPREISTCNFALLQDDVLVIKDVQKDDRFREVPLLIGPFKFGFYAGVPIVSADGYKLGTIAALDTIRKKPFSVEQKNALKIIARQVDALLELRIKNKSVVRNRDEIVAEEKKIAQQTLTEQEEEKSFIANELHENFAQTLAATKLYLDFAEQSKELSSLFITKSKDNILQIIRDIKTLSRSMLPSTYRNANYLEFIEEMLNEYGKRHGIVVGFTHKGKLDCYEANIGLTLFRIIQYQLKNAHNCGAKKISINVKTNSRIKLGFVDDGKNTDNFEPERKMLLHHIKTRIELVNGTVNVTVDKKGNNLLEIEIPVDKSK